MNPSTSLHGNVSDESSYASVSLPSILTQTTNSISPLVQRVALATVIFPHGAQKLLGWFGGYGFKGTMAFFYRNHGNPVAARLGGRIDRIFRPDFVAHRTRHASRRPRISGRNDHSHAHGSCSKCTAIPQPEENEFLKVISQRDNGEI